MTCVTSKDGTPGETVEKKTGICDKALVLLLTITFIQNTIYGLASPFMPVVLQEKGISSGMTGVIFAVYAVASVLSSIVIGMYMDQVGHRCVIIFGTLLMAISIASFGLIEDMTDYAIVLAIAITSRSFESAASGLMNTAVYSYSALAYP